MRVRASEAKNRFGDVILEAQREPVIVERWDKPVAVILSVAEYERLLALEDRLWGERALEAEKEGLLSPEATAAFLRRMGEEKRL